MTVNQSNAPQNPLDNLSVDELQIKLAKASEGGNFDEARNILDKIREKTQSPKDTTQELGVDVKKELDKINQNIATETDPEKKQQLSEKKSELLEKFLTKDLATYKASQSTLEDSKEARLKELQSKLHETYTTMPGLMEYLSRERRRLVTIHSKIQEFKQDRQNYPKNFLIYAMSLTSSSTFGIRQGINRQRIRVTRRRQSDQIGTQLSTFENMLNTSQDDKAPWKRGLKNLLKEELLEAKKAYLEQQRINIGLAAA